MNKANTVHSEINIPVFEHHESLWAVSNMPGYTFVEEVEFVGVILKMLPVGEYDEPLVVVACVRDGEILKVPLNLVFHTREDAFAALVEGEIETMELVIPQQTESNTAPSNVIAFSLER